MMSPAIVPPAPGLFSTTIDWPTTSESASPMMRLVTSVPPPAPNPTRMRIGRVGQSSAATGEMKTGVPASTSAANTAHARRSSIAFLPGCAGVPQRLCPESIALLQDGRYRAEARCPPGRRHRPRHHCIAIRALVPSGRRERVADDDLADQLIRAGGEAEAEA